MASVGVWLRKEASKYFQVGGKAGAPPSGDKVPAVWGQDGGLRTLDGDENRAKLPFQPRESPLRVLNYPVRFNTPYK